MLIDHLDMSDALPGESRANGMPDLDRPNGASREDGAGQERQRKARSTPR